MMDNCGVCGQKLVHPYGSTSAPVLFMGEFPGIEELKKGWAFTGKAGVILEQELARAGFPPKDRRYTNLWLHGADMGKGTKPLITTDCYRWMYGMAVEEFKGRKGILLMGSELARSFLNTNISSVYGLQVFSSYWSDDTIVVASPNPAVCLHGGVGEFRLALTKFKEKVYDKAD